jgi:hypothetical protein
MTECLIRVVLEGLSKGLRMIVYQIENLNIFCALSEGLLRAEGARIAVEDAREEAIHWSSTLFRHGSPANGDVFGLWNCRIGPCGHRPMDWSLQGFAFVEMSSQSEAQEALEALNSTRLEGQKLIVNEAKPREKRTRGAGQHRF